MTIAAPSHACQFRERIRWGPWRGVGGLEEREAYRVAICTQCGAERPSRRRRPPFAVARRTIAAGVAPAPDPRARTVAAELVRRARTRAEVRLLGLQGDLASRGITASLLEEILEIFLRVRWVSLVSSVRGTRRSLTRIAILDFEGIEEFAHPGRSDERRRALDLARATLASASHPIARDVARILDENAREASDPKVVRALVAVACHVEAGEVLAARVFSARHLGSSKALEGLRPRLERLLGPLEHLGIRDGAATVFFGGVGHVRVVGVDLDLDRIGPFLGIARERLLSDFEIELPPGGLFLVENFTPFVACSVGEVAFARGTLVVWTAGYPGRAVRALVERANAARARIRLWADLDLDGIRIARLAAAWAGGAIEVVRMSPHDLAAARATLPLSERANAAIRADLAEQPDGFLAETLRALLETGRWVEQEVFLGRG